MANPSPRLDFKQAMADFSTMFPTLDKDVIETVLRANQGSVDATIDHLLAMTEDSSESSGKTEQKENPPQPPTNQEEPTHFYVDELLAAASDRPPNVPAPRLTSTQASPTCDEKLIDFDDDDSAVAPPSGPPLPPTSLPAAADSNDARERSDREFAEKLQQGNAVLTLSSQMSCLRVVLHFVQEQDAEERRRHDSRDTAAAPFNSGLLQIRLREIEHQIKSAQIKGDHVAETLLNDERMAVLLQNDEFISELSANADFMSSLQNDQRAAATAFSSSGAGDAAAAEEPASRAAAATSTTTDDIKRQLTHMGKSTKQRLQGIANRFFASRRQKQSGMNQALINEDVDDQSLNDSPPRRLSLEPDDTNAAREPRSQRGGPNTALA